MPEFYFYDKESGTPPDSQINVSGTGECGTVFIASIAPSWHSSHRKFAY